MTLADAIKQAVADTDDLRRARRIASVADCMRFKLGLNYAQSLRMVQKVLPDMTPAAWDALLYEADQYASY